MFALSLNTIPFHFTSKQQENHLNVRWFDHTYENIEMLIFFSFFFRCFEFNFKRFFFALNIWQHFVLIEFKMKKEKNHKKLNSSAFCGYGIFQRRRRKKTEIYVISVSTHICYCRRNHLRIRSVFFFYSLNDEKKVKSTALKKYFNIT